MAKLKYHFDTESFKVEKVRITFKDRLKRFLYISFAGMIFAVVIIVIANNFFDSPKERMLEREIAQYKLQHEILNARIDLIGRVLKDLEERDDNIYRVILEAEPISSSKRQAGFGGVDRYAALEGYKNSELIIEATAKLDQIANKMYVQSKSFDEVFDLAKNKEEMLRHIPAIQPVKNVDLKRISSYFGYRTDPFYKVKKFHAGLDFSAPIGTEIFTTGDGKVISTKKSRRGYGNTILIDHGFNYVTKYSHLASFKVRKGQQVKRGQVIGTVGNTGKSTAPHLHYEVQKNGRAVNPIYYFFNDLTPEQFEEIIELSTRPTQSMD